MWLLLSTYISVACIAFIIRVTRIGELGTTLAVTIKSYIVFLYGEATHRFCASVASCLLTFVPRRFLSPSSWRLYIPPKRPFLQEPHGVTSQKTAFDVQRSSLLRLNPLAVCKLQSTKKDFQSNERPRLPER
jgi:hypothetical protein